MQFVLVKIVVFTWLVILPILSFADAVQERRIIISASIFPRIIAVDQQIASKTDEKGNVRLGILYHSDIGLAKKIKTLMNRKVSKISGKKVIIDIVNIGNDFPGKSDKFSGIFLVESITDKHLAEVQSYSIKHHVLLFSPFEGDVEHGVMAGIFVGAKIRPYFNVTSLKKGNISLKPALMKASKTYE